MCHRVILRNLWYDCKYLWRSRRWRWMIGIGVQIFVFAMNVQDMYLVSKKISVYDVWFSTFSGIREYIKTENGEFELPVLWVLFHAYLLFILCDYMIDGLSNQGVQSLVRNPSRKIWLFRRTLICSFSVILFYLQYAVIAFIGLLLTGSSGVYSRVGIYYCDAFQHMGWERALFMPIVMSVVLQLIQNTCEILLGSYTAYLISLIGLVLAAYKMSPFLIGNYGMLLRSNLLSENGMTMQGEIAVCAIFLLVAAVTSVYFVEKFDVVGKGLEDKWK